jgi:hypothetical protein
MAFKLEYIDRYLNVYVPQLQHTGEPPGIGKYSAACR